MRQNDPMRFMAWQEAREKGQTLQKEAYQAQERQQQEQSQRYQAYQTAESRQGRAVPRQGARQARSPPRRSVRRSGRSWSTTMALPTRKCRRCGTTPSRCTWPTAASSKWRSTPMPGATANAKKAAAADSRKPVPPVQRPGTATNRGEAANVSLKILSDRLSKTGRLEDAVAYQNLKSQIASRRR